MRSIIVGLIGLCLLLASCDSAGKVTPEAVIAAIKENCGIVTTVADIGALIIANPAVTGAAGFAHMVCDVFLKTKQARHGDILQQGVLDVGGTHIHYTVQ